VSRILSPESSTIIAMLALFSGDPSSEELADEVPAAGNAGTLAGHSVVQLT
jgi:hypothetical protein